MRFARVGAWTALAGLLAGCPSPEVRYGVVERPLGQAEALDIIQQTLVERGATCERFVPVMLPNQQGWNIDVACTGMAIAVEYLTDQDRERIGALVPIPARPDETPRVIIVKRTGVDGPAANLYLRVFTDVHFTFQPNPPPDMPEAPYTIREVQARLRRDVRDFATWYAENHGSGNTP
jgi:hypothetical protein